MNKKIIFVVASTLLVTLALFTPFASAQSWSYCYLSVPGTEITINEEQGFLSFTVKYGEPGMPSTIELSNSSNGAYYERNFESGNTVIVSYSGLKADDVNIDAHDHIIYEGPVDSVTINAVVIPEFSSFIILPLFIMATLLAAIVYRRKRT